MFPYMSRLGNHKVSINKEIKKEERKNERREGKKSRKEGIKFFHLKKSYSFPKVVEKYKPFQI